MKSLFTIWIAALTFGLAMPSMAVGDKGLWNVHQPLTISSETADFATARPLVVSTFRRSRGDHFYYGVPYYQNHYYDGKHRPRSSFPYVYGKKRFHDHGFPYRYYGEGYYRPQGGGFGISACFRSGSVRICINQSYPYRYR